MFARPDTAIHQNSHGATSQNSALATKLQNAQAQSAAPATRKRHGNIDRVPNYCACHATRKHHHNACHKTAQNHAICEEIGLLQIILSYFVSAAQRQGNNAIVISNTSGWQRTAANARATVGKQRPTPRPPLINGNPSLRIGDKKSQS